MLTPTFGRVVIDALVVAAIEFDGFAEESNASIPKGKLGTARMLTGKNEAAESARSPIVHVDISSSRADLIGTLEVVIPSADTESYGSAMGVEVAVVHLASPTTLTDDDHIAQSVGDVFEGAFCSAREQAPFYYVATALPRSKGRRHTDVVARG